MVQILIFILLYVLFSGFKIFPLCLLLLAVWVSVWERERVGGSIYPTWCWLLFLQVFLLLVSLCFWHSNSNYVKPWWSPTALGGFVLFSFFLFVFPTALMGHRPFLLLGLWCRVCACLLLWFLSVYQHRPEIPERNGSVYLFVCLFACFYFCSSFPSS